MTHHFSKMPRSIQEDGAMSMQSRCSSMTLRQQAPLLAAAGRMRNNTIVATMQLQ